MTTKTFSFITNFTGIVFVAALLAPQAGHASAGAIIKPLAEIVEHTWQQAAKRFPGGLKATTRESVGEALEAVVREGGEDAVEASSRLIARHGDEALLVIKRVDTEVVLRVAGLPEDLAPAALGALRRHPEALRGLPSELTEAALRAESKAPGAGLAVVRTLGDDGAALAQRLSEAQLVRARAYAPEIAALPAPQRGKLLELMKSSPGVVLDALDRKGVQRLAAMGLTAGALTLVGLEAVASGAEVGEAMLTQQTERPDGTREVHGAFSNVATGTAGMRWFGAGVFTFLAFSGAGLAWRLGRPAPAPATVPAPVPAPAAAAPAMADPQQPANTQTTEDAA